MNLDLFTCPKPEDCNLFSLSDGELLNLMIRPYGIHDVGDWLETTVHEHIVNDLFTIPRPAKSHFTFVRTIRKVRGGRQTYAANMFNMLY